MGKHTLSSMSGQSRSSPANHLSPSLSTGERYLIFINSDRNNEDPLFLQLSFSCFGGFLVFFFSSSPSRL